MIKDRYDYAIENNLVRADKDGTIYKRYANGEMRKTWQKKGANGYKCLQVMINGKQKILVAHRIVAKTYIPNPENKPQVNHIDGDKGNNHVENLEWCTAKENAKHAFEMLSPKCPYCGDNTKTSDGICPECRRKIAKSERSRRVVNIGHVKKELKCANLEKLCERDREIIRLRKAGKSYQEIGNIQGISRQRVHQIIKRIISKT